MKRVSLLTLSASLLFAAPAMADATEAGMVVKTEGEAGAVRIFRNGANEAAAVGDALQFGDRIVTLPGGAVEFQYGACTSVLNASQTVVLDETTCARLATDTLDAADQSGVVGGGPDGGAVALNQTGLETIPLPVIVAGGAAVTGAVVVGVVVATDDDDDEPASP